MKARDSVGNETSYCGHAADTAGYGKFTTAVGQAVGIDNVTDGTNTITTLDGTKYLLDSNATVNIALNETPTSSVKLHYDDSSTLPSATIATASGSGTSWTATISATDANVYNGATVYFVVEVDATTFYRTGTTPWSYKVDGAPPENVGCKTPADGATGVSTVPTLTALTATDAGVGLHSTPYYFQLATDNGFTQNVQTSGWKTGSSWIPSTLNMSTTYYWRVKAKDSLGNESNYCSHWRFTTMSMFLSLTTSKENYKLNETIQISGTAKDLAEKPIPSGTTTIHFTCENWSDNVAAPISNGIYSCDYQTTFTHPEGTWIVRAIAVDAYGNTGENSISIAVIMPEPTAFCTVKILKPAAGDNLMRGEKVRITVQVENEETGARITGAQVSIILPSGEESMMEDNVNSGTYFLDYTPGWGDQLGSWVASIKVRKVVENVLIGEPENAENVNVKIKPATNLRVVLLSPLGRVSARETVQIRAKATYPDGTPIDNAVLRVILPSGENLDLWPEEAGTGIYSRDYTVTSKDIGRWDLMVSDLYNNSGSETVTIEAMEAGILTAYWWAFLAMFAAIGVASAYVTRRVILVRRLKYVRQEMQKIPKLKKEAMIKYFKEGSIERDTYDRLMDKYDMQMGGLRKQEELLSTKVGEKVKAKKAKRKRR